MTRPSRHRQLAPLALVLAGCVCLAGLATAAGDKAGKGKGDKLSTINPANYKKLKDGMTEKEILKILGKPTSTSPQSLGELGTGKVLSWKRTGAAIIVLFRDGKAIAHKGAFGKDAQALTPKLSKEAYERVKFDMTEKEVLAILGPPTEVSSPEGMPNVRTLVWISGGNRATVTLRDGKVEATQAMFVD
jgi:hypothetical protein